MTPEELEAAIRAGDLNGCVEWVTAATEAERRAAAPLGQRWLKAAWDRHLDRTAEVAIDLPRDAQQVQRIAKTASAAVAGTATLSELKSLAYRVWHFEEEAWRLLAARRPDWLAGWADWVLGESARSWIYVRHLVRDGLIEKPSVDHYTTAMLGYVWPHSALDLLRSDPELLEDEVWRLFRVEGAGENSLAARDKYSSGERTWSHALQTLSREGQLCRQRLLDESLGALERDFAQFRVGWYAQFHEALSPTLGERAARVDRYLALLASPIPPTVSFALKALTLLDKEDRLPAEALLGHVAPALGAREKGTVKAALRLLERAAKREPAYAEAAALLACEALLHEGPDVQEAAFKLIQRYDAPDHAELRGLLQARLDDLAASQRSAVEAWLGVESGPAAPSPAADAVPADLESRARAFPADLARLAGVEAALQAWQNGTWDLPPLRFIDPRIPRLAPENALQPITELDELIDRFSAVLENPDSPEEIERVLDGVSRLCGERPPDFERRTDPLRKRALKLVGRKRGLPWSGYLPHDLPEVAVSWLCGTVAKPVKQDSDDLTYFLGLRMHVLAERIAARQPGPLLGAPTHSGGWIDPRVLVARLRAWLAAGGGSQTPPKRGWPLRSRYPYPDVIQALLRLAPDGRAEALAACAGLEGEIVDAFRYAFGASDVEIGPDAALWIAASRARDPRVDDPYVEARHPNRGPDTTRVARPELQVERWSYQDCGKEHIAFRVTLGVDPPVPDDACPEIPTVLFYEDHEADANALRWLATVWPGGREAWLAKGAWMIGANLDWWEAEWENRVYLEALLDPDTDLGGMGGILLGLGLATKEPGESSLATDALIAGIQDGRVTGASLADVLSYLLTLGVDPAPDTTRPGGVINASRWAKTLAGAARVSPLHAAVVHRALQRTLGSAPSLRPADLAALLELLRELSVSLGAAIDDPATRQYLAGIKAGGKSGKLAQALLGLAANELPDHARQAAALALAARVERAERWARSGWA